MATIPHVTFGEAFRWIGDRESVHRLCSVDEGQGRRKHIDIYISREALEDATGLTNRDPGELENAAEGLWDRRILPIVVRRISAGKFSPDGTIVIRWTDIEG